MDTNNLRYFAAVAQYGSITRAAKAMYISQPQLSHIIKQLEREMGMTLFRRTSQGTCLTMDGQRILSHCRIILQELDQLQNLTSSRKQDAGCLNVSMTRFSHTAQCFNEICRRYQDVDRFSNHLCEAAPLDVISQVKSGYSNVGVIHMTTARKDLESYFALQGLQFIPLASFSPYVCLSAQHELIRRFGRRGIHFQDLRDYGFVRYIGQYEDFIYHISTEKGPVDLNETRKIVYVNDRQEQMVLLSRTNFFTVGIMEFQGQDSLYKVVSIPLLGCSEHLRFGVLLNQGAMLSRMETDFIQLLRKCFAQLQKEGDSLAS